MLPVPGKNKKEDDLVSLQLEQRLLTRSNGLIPVPSVVAVAGLAPKMARRDLLPQAGRHHKRWLVRKLLGPALWVHKRNRIEVVQRNRNNAIQIYKKIEAEMRVEVRR